MVKKSNHDQAPPPGGDNAERLVRLLKSNDLKRIQKARNEVARLKAKKRRH